MAHFPDASDIFQGVIAFNQNEIGIFTSLDWVLYKSLVHHPGRNDGRWPAVYNSLENKPLVIFITAYKQYAIDGYELAVADHLVKPVSLKSFIKTCSRAKEMYELKSLKQQT